MNILIEQCNWFLENERNSNGFFKEILKEIKPYIINKLATEYDRYNRHPFASEIITHKEELMTIWSEYQRNKTEQQIIKDKNWKDYKEQQYKVLDEKLKTKTGVPDMRKSMEQVRQSEVKINRDYARLTSSSLVV